MRRLVLILFIAHYLEKIYLGAVSVAPTGLASNPGSQSPPRADVNVIGGEVLKDPNNPRYMAAAEESLQNSNLNYNVKLVLQATQQVVAGLLTRVYFIATGHNGVAHFCHAEVLDQPWAQGHTDSLNCLPTDPQVRPGGLENPNELRYQRLAERALQKYLPDKGKSNGYVVSVVFRATYLPVRGQPTTVDFSAAGRGGPPLRCHAELRQFGGQEEFLVNCQKLDVFLSNHTPR